MVTQSDVDFRIAPYIQEAIIQLIIDTIIATLTLVLFVYIEISLIICVAIVLAYFGLEVMFFYRIVIQALIDKKKKDYIIEMVSIKTFKEEFSLAGSRTGHSYISSLYPKEWHTGKYKLEVINAQGDKKKIRSVMSLRRMLQFLMLEKQKIISFQITYLKRSKILIYVKPEYEITKKNNNKKTKQIEKSLHFINERI